MQNKPFIVRVGFALLILVAITLGLWLASPREWRQTKEVPRIARSLLTLKDGRLCSKESGAAFTGIAFERTVDGVTLSEIPLQNGIIHGLAKRWHENGKIELEENFAEGVSDGLRTRWHLNGQKRSTTMIVKGVLEGPYTEWHDNGQLALQMHLEEGKGEGLSEAWFPDGKPKSKVTLKNGEAIETKYFTSTAP